MCRVGLAGQRASVLRLGRWDWLSACPRQPAVDLIISNHNAALVLPLTLSSFFPLIKQPPPRYVVSYQFFLHCCLSAIVCALKCMTSFKSFGRMSASCFPLLLLATWFWVCHNCHKELLCPKCVTLLLFSQRDKKRPEGYGLSQACCFACNLFSQLLWTTTMVLALGCCPAWSLAAFSEGHFME